MNCAGRFRDTRGNFVAQPGIEHSLFCPTYRSLITTPPTELSANYTFRLAISDSLCLETHLKCYVPK